MFVDNGEFACGSILKNCLTKVEGFNVLVCVSIHSQGMFVTDMLQTQKLRAVKEATSKVLELLKEHLTNASKKPPVQVAPTLQPRDSFYFDSKQVDLQLPGIVPSKTISNKIMKQLSSGSSANESWAASLHS